MLHSHLAFLCFVVALLHGACAIEVSSSKDEESTNHAIVAVETDEDTAKDVVTKLNVQFGKDVYDPDLPEFEPTSEWKSVRQGQAIPKGLHVRLNLETGEKEAKLLPEDDGKRFKRDTSKKTSYSGQGHPSRLQAMKDEIEMAMKTLEKEKNEYKYWSEGNREGMMNMNKKTFSRQELKEALENFKANQDDTKGAMKAKENIHRHIKDIKKDFADLKMEMKTDFEILQELLTKYNNTGLSTQERVNLLTDLEYYLHQVDNAKLFAELGGLDLLISDLNNTNEDVRSEAAFAIGSAVQSNPSVQVRAVEGAIMQQLIRMLSTEQAIKVRSRVTYALASLIRLFPYAQQNFLELGGLTAVSNLFKEPNTEKLQLKVVTLIADILIEIRTNVGNLESADSIAKERAEQYRKIPLIRSLLEHGWCTSLPGLLATTEHDAREKVLNAMSELVDDCWPNFRSSLSLLQTLQKEYEALSLTENRDNDHYFTEILGTVNKLIGEISVWTKNEL